MLNIVGTYFPELVVCTMAAFMLVIGAVGIEQAFLDRSK